MEALAVTPAAPWAPATEVDLATVPARPERGPRAVVCDDDPVLRGVISRLARDHGIDVVAETDNPGDAADLAERFAIDELILDLSLAGGRGEDALAAMRAKALSCRVVVFSSFAGESQRLLAAGASAVVEKPDFVQLEAVLDQHVIEHREERGGATERRRPRPSRPEVPHPTLASPSGIAPFEALDDLLPSLRPGDAVLIVTIDGIDSVERRYGRLFAADHRADLARLVRSTVRHQDRLAAGPDDELVVLLLDGHPEAAEVVFQRLAVAWDRRGGLGSIRAGWSSCDRDAKPRDVVTRANGARASTTPGLSSPQLRRG